MNNQPDLFSELPESSLPVRKTPLTRFATYVQVAVQGPFYQPFTYGVLESMGSTISVGQLVSVPFGHQSVAGCVTGISQDIPAGVAVGKIRGVSAIRTPSFRVSADLLDLSAWIAEQTMASLGDTIGCVSFIGFADIESKTRVYYRLTAQWLDGRIRPRTLGSKMKAIITLLESRGNAPMHSGDLSEALEAKSVSDALRRLEKLQIVERFLEVLNRPDEYTRTVGRDKAPEFNEEQQGVAAVVRKSIIEHREDVFLLHGVTGSGKTEIYLDAIQKALELGGEAICLVPEISLTPQAVERFRRRFGDTVGVYHSRLNTGQKYDLWHRVETGQCRIMIGARSALFTPFKNLKVIVLDEEHEASYKQGSAPRYHCRDVAVEIGRRRRIPVILGSATPSIESYYEAVQGRWHLLPMLRRVDARPLPPVEIVDMSRELVLHPETDLLSQQLKTAVSEAINAGEMSILFLNRRGFFSLIRCSNCGATLRCTHCEVPLTYHKQGNILKCHYCEQQYAPITDCPNCALLGITGSLTALGIGTQRLEETLEKQFPQARIKRMDLDTTRSKTAFIDAWDDISNGKTDILLGTQMIARGLHIENVTVVGVPLADVSLFQADFRAAERTFSLLTQVAGRAGRGDKPGRVYIQTYAPYHYAVRFAQNHDYEGFYRKEIHMREVLRFPPFSSLASVLCTGKDEVRVGEMVEEFARILRAYLWEINSQEVTVLGPTPAPVPKIEDTYRRRILLRSVSAARIRELLRYGLKEYAKVPGHQHVTVTVDINPGDLM